MLQQTQVATVIGYFERFLQRFPTVDALAAAPVDDVLALWSGLGYYSRARNLHKAAKKIICDFGGEFPHDTQQLMSLPGVGRSTAAAIAALAFGKRAAIMDGNVKRVLSRVFAVSEQNMLANEKRLWEYAESLAPEMQIESYTQGLMDLGATLCTRSKPRCTACPFERDCVAHQRGEEAAYPKRKVKTTNANVAAVEDFALTSSTTTPHNTQRKNQRNHQRRVEHAVFLLAYQGDALLLERRPDSGIWGGLWCAPQCMSVDEAMTMASRMGRIASHHIGIERKHSFTHFDLYATPLRVEFAQAQAYAAETQPLSKWVTVKQALQMGIPALLRVWLAEEQA